ncbi:uncharacterized protein LOC123209958 isoform X2 [Mangifera indica]|uniref:uncharacterized protein LOC123209958 isoform X2 n=1 Tax=Mangifera indica TaxID=29780 RepID=UPI001CFA35A3|nr:uncharacterized protein LOC123209958 isoform X2 [Mangifera indica]
METLEPRSVSQSTSNSNSNLGNLSSSSVPSPQTPPSSVLRLWRPAAQRNLRNQWSKMASYRQQWLSASSSGRLHATSLVNSYLSQRYIPSMELGALSDMPDIRKKASYKLFKQQVAITNYMISTSRSMRSFLKGPSSSPLVQFSSYSEDTNDTGDGGGTPVFALLSITVYEKLAMELVQMFKLELILKRLLVVELLSIGSETNQVNELSWSDELYLGEFDDLRLCDLYSNETCEPVSPKLKDWNSDKTAVQCNCQPSQEILQVALTTWLAEVNIDTQRVNEIFTVVGEEMHVNIL